MRVDTGMNVTNSESVTLGYIGEVIGRKETPTPRYVLLHNRRITWEVFLQTMGHSTGT